jgi:hypothetical protein
LTKNDHRTPNSRFRLPLSLFSAFAAPLAGSCPKTVQKKFKKLLTLSLPFGIVASHTVTYSKKMRTKTLLLTAAAMAAGLATSIAQSNVYSANVVGYVNVVTPAGQPVLISNPLDLDGTDNVAVVLTNAPKGTLVQIWNGAGFTPVSRSLFGAGAWSASAATNNIPPGVGFFMTTPTAYTNTFVGNVVPANGGTNNLPMTGLFQLVASVLPVSGTVTNAADQGSNTLNLASLPKGTLIQLWNGAGYTPISRSLFGAGLWSGNANISVGQGFFIKTGSTTNWVQTLSLP